ncbi:MAG: hypothetical protein VXZ96_00160 [Myxococcota bacterium]|nr:hypothetical protein [Myxococcota bacterium]MEC8378696.1 hypothetical protein [Myxococcota bacterium]
MSAPSSIIELLNSKLIPERAEAIRHLENEGELDDLSLLLTHLTQDKSPAIRLMAADAFSDIVSRYRMPPKRAQLTDDERADWLSKVMEISIQDNITVALIIATLDLPQSLMILINGFRHTHSEVRLASAVGLMRYLQSARMRSDLSYEQTIKMQLIDMSMHSDSVVYLAELCVAFNIKSALPLLNAFELHGEHARLVDIAKSKLRSDQEPLDGLWYSDGNDAGEYNPNPYQEPEFLMIHGQQRLVRRKSEHAWTSCPEDAQVFPLYYRRIGQSSSERVIQIGVRSYYKCKEDELEQLLHLEGVAQNYLEMDSQNLTPSPHLQVLAETLSSQIPEDISKYWRDLGGIWLRAGHPERALAALETALLGKRTPVDTFFFIGEAHRLLDNPTEATAAWTTCLAKSRSNRPAHVKWCNIRLEK